MKFKFALLTQKVVWFIRPGKANYLTIISTQEQCTQILIIIDAGERIILVVCNNSIGGAVKKV